MILLISYDNGYKEGFISWLVYVLKKELLYKIKRNKLLAFENYINSFDNEFKNILTKYNLSLYNMLVYGINNLTYFKTRKGYVIGIDPYKYIPGSKIPIKSFCKLIDNGVFGINGYPILSKHLNSVTNNLREYFKTYEKQFYI